MVKKAYCRRLKKIAAGVMIIAMTFPATVTSMADTTDVVRVDTYSDTKTVTEPGNVTITTDGGGQYAAVEAEIYWDGGDASVTVGGDVTVTATNNDFNSVEGARAFAREGNINVTVDIAGDVTVTADLGATGVSAEADLLRNSDYVKEGDTAKASVSIGGNLKSESAHEASFGESISANSGGETVVSVGGSVTSKGDDADVWGLNVLSSDAATTANVVKEVTAESSSGRATGVSAYSTDIPNENDGTFVSVGGDVTAVGSGEVYGIDAATYGSGRNYVTVGENVKASLAENGDPDSKVYGVFCENYGGDGVSEVTVKKNVEADGIGVSVETYEDKGAVTVNIGGDVNAADGIRLTVFDPESGTSAAKTTVVVEGTVTAENAVTVAFGSEGFEGPFGFDWDAGEVITKGDPSAVPDMSGISVHVWKVESENPVITATNLAKENRFIMAYDDIKSGNTDSKAVQECIDYINEYYPGVFSGLTKESFIGLLETDESFLTAYNNAKEAIEPSEKQALEALQKGQKVQYIIRVTNVDNASVALNGTETGTLISGDTYQYAAAGTDIVIMVTTVSGYEVTGVEGGSAIAAKNADGTYTLRVPEGGGVDIRAVIQAIKEADPENDEEIVIPTDDSKKYSHSSSDDDSGILYPRIPETEGTWKQDAEGNWFMETPDGGIYKNIWIRSKMNWYYAGPDGIIIKGWLKIGNYWYYFANDGTMLTGWQMIDGVKYHLNDSLASMPIGAWIE